MKFKIGDKVKFVKKVELHSGKVKLGNIYKIENVGFGYCMPYRIENGEYFNEEELELAEYTYENLKKSPIGTKITFESGKVLVKTREGRFENYIDYTHIEYLKNLKNNSHGKIIKIEEPTYETVYEYKPEILDETEKRYLKNFIRPFKDSVETIRRLYSPTKKKDYIQIRYKDDRPTNLPYFERDTMYKKMEINKNYTLEELGL